MSSRLNLVNQIGQPKSRHIVESQCTKCGIINKSTLVELIRKVNRQSAYTDKYHCPSCLRALPNYINAFSDKSKSVRSKIIVGGSERSKNLWNDPKYRGKMASVSNKLKNDVEFAQKISASIINKFKYDQDYVDRVNASRKNSSTEFIARCSDIHDNYYDYSITEYTFIDVKFKVICPEHGTFEQLPSNHVKGHGCPKCAKCDSKISSLEFFSRCSTLHAGKYDYTNSIYIASADYIKYKCPVHGEIIQLAQNHLRGHGCRFCDQQKTTSKGEEELAEFISQYAAVKRNCRDILDNSEIDIIVGNVGFEYHGLYWHSYNRIETNSERYKHFNKLNEALLRNVELIQIYEDEWMQRRDIVKSMIKSKLGILDNRIYARKCRVINLEEKVASDFFNKNHLNGHRKAKIYLGLEYDGEIVSSASFSHTGKYWELIRFCSCLNISVAGGLSRLLSHSGLRNIFTYADRRYSPRASSYLSCGFKELGVTQPGYKYCKGLKTYSRQSYQKSKQSKLLPIFDASKTEAQNMFNNGYRRIWDAGHYRLGL